MRISSLLTCALVAMLFVATGCAEPESELIEGPVFDNGGFSPEELSGESDQAIAENLGDS